MYRLPSLMLSAVLSTSAMAQINAIQHDGTTEFTSRGIAGAVDGWAHNGYKVDRQGGGIGGRGVVGLSCIMQDQNCATLETFQFAIFGGNTDRATGLPNVGNPTWGRPDSWPDVSNVLGSTATFRSPAGMPTGPCAWIFTTTFASPIDMTVHGDVFTSVLLVSNVNWLGDGPSSHISLATTSAPPANFEFPIVSADANTNLEMNTEFGINWIGLGPASGGAAFVPSTKRFWLNNLRYDHSSRAGVIDTTGAWSPVLSLNFGLAGDYPDAANITGLMPAPGRRDELVWSDQHSTDFALGTGFGQVLLATSMLRDLAAPLALPGTGLLEVNPIDPLFHLGATVPGLLMPIAIGGAPTIYRPFIPLAQAPGVAPILHLNQVNIYAQVLRVNLMTGTAVVGSCDAHSFRR